MKSVFSIAITAKMKRFSLAVAGILCVGFGFGQVPDKPYSYTFTKGTCDCTFTGVTLDQVWAASVKAFMTQTWKGNAVDSSRLDPLSLDRPSGVMIGSWISGHDWLVGQYSMRLQILIEQRKEGVGMYCTVPGNNNKLKEKIGKMFFERVAELLYGKT